MCKKLLNPQKNGKQQERIFPNFPLPSRHKTSRKELQEQQQQQQQKRS